MLNFGDSKSGTLNWSLSLYNLCIAEYISIDSFRPVLDSFQPFSHNFLAGCEVNLLGHGPHLKSVML